MGWFWVPRTLSSTGGITIVLSFVFEFSNFRPEIEVLLPEVGQVSALLDVEDPIPGEYNLEVSSPGLNRRLVKEAHFERFAGSRVKLKLKRVVDGRRNYKGRLVGYDEPNVLVKEGKETFAIPFQEIDTARVVPDFG